MELKKEQKEQLRKANELIIRAKSILSDIKVEEPAEEEDEELDEEQDSLEDKLSELVDSLESVESDIDDLNA